MAKQPTIVSVTSGYMSATQITANDEALQAAFDNTLSLDGSTPNAMTADLDMNSNDIINAKTIYVNGANLLSLLNHITISTDAPTGGANGDIWFRVTT
jgi:hypothetical protein